MNHPSIARLKASLKRVGEAVIIRRYTAAGTHVDVATLAHFANLSAAEIRPGANNTQLNGRAILEPTALASLLPLRTTDKIVRDGQERQIGWVNNSKIGTEYVRIIADFQG